MIEGIPDGWELVLADDGTIKLCNFNSARMNCPIIRKKPKQYRPFANAAEAMPFWDAKVRRKADGSGVFRVVAIGETTVGIGFSLFSFMDAFNGYECYDGTPFGVEVQS